MDRKIMVLFWIVGCTALSAGFSQDPFTVQVSSTHQQVINGKTLSYEATTGFLPVIGRDQDTVIQIHYTYYRVNSKNSGERPLLISFNGGPGSASAWMHLAYTGPFRLKIDDEGYPIQPYGYQQNPYSVLDVTDILYVNPVNTGYSRFVSEKVETRDYFGINEDIAYLSDWINAFLNRYNRWKSPKYLIGESYGTTRVAGLVSDLQTRHWAYFNGVVLVSPTEMGIERNGPVKIANRVPYYTAAAWYHNRLPDDLQKLDLPQVLEISEEFAVRELLPALSLGGYLSDGERSELAEKMSGLTGIASRVILQAHLDLPTTLFWKELLRDQGFNIGRLDSRYKGKEESQIGTTPSYYSAISSWLHSFTPAVNAYFSDHLGFSVPLKYNMFGSVQPWNRQNENTGEDLRQAMLQNPYLHLMVQSGYYDGATNYFDAKYTLRHINRSGILTERIQFKGYRSGHMMYLRKDDLKTANQDLRAFILGSIPRDAAKY